MRHVCRLQFLDFKKKAEASGVRSEQTLNATKEQNNIPHTLNTYLIVTFAAENEVLFLL